MKKIILNSDVAVGALSGAGVAMVAGHG